MKIAIACFNLEWQAGGPRLIFSQAQAFKKMGHEVVIYAPKVDSHIYSALQEGLDIREIKPAHSLLWQYSSSRLIVRIKEKIQHYHGMNQVARQIADAMDRDFDIVNLHDFAYKIAPHYSKINSRAKLIWTMNEPPIAYLPKPGLLYNLASRAYNAILGKTERRVFQKIHGVVVVVERYKKWAEKRGMFARVVWTGIDVAQFNFPAKEFKEGKPIKLLSLGALNPYRRFEDVVLATGVLRKKGYNVYTTIVCRNIWKEDACKESLEKLVGEQGLQDFVRLNFEGVKEDELGQLYAANDFFLSMIHTPPPRSGYGWQLVVFEAMATGTPTFLCTTNDATEALSDGQNAVFVDPENPNDIAEKIQKLVDNPEVYKRVAIGGQNFVNQNMSWEKYANQFLDFTAAVGQVTLVSDVDS